MKNQTKVSGMVTTALFAALIIIMAFTPFLGYIPLGFTRATIIQVPVILASLMLGPGKGAILGGIFGMTSFINNTINPTVTSFVFTPFYSLGGVEGGVPSIIICFLPRILTGVVPCYVYKAIKKAAGHRKKGSFAALVSAGVTGSLTNTLLVMNMIFIFFGDQYAAANNIAAVGAYRFILSIIGINGIPEAIISGVLVAVIGRVLMNKRVRSNL